MECEGLRERVSQRKVARVLLADCDLASRLTLKSLLGKAGYWVEAASSAAEAVAKLDAHQFQLVLADLRTEPDNAGASLLSYARQKAYRPATARIASDISDLESGNWAASSPHATVTMSDENVSDLLAGVAELISLRALRRIRLAGNAA